MRMSMRRFTRLTNAFSKKLENHEYALALYFMNYNFVWPHKTLANPYPRTPAMAARFATRIWTIEDIVGLIGECRVGDCDDVLMTYVNINMNIAIGKYQFYNGERV
jgi:hypothetical protein